MRDFIAKTFGGLTRRYYLRQVFFAVLIGFFTLGGIMHQTRNGFQTAGIAGFMIVNILLYPYSRFVYESIVDFFVGNNVFYVNGTLMLIAKVFTMMMCYMFALFIAPIGLIYLYFYNSRR